MSSQTESEKTAKVYQVAELSNKLDNQMTQSLERHKALEQSILEIKQMISAQNNTYPTRTEMALELEKRDNKIETQGGTIKNFVKVLWILAGTMIPMVALAIWQLIVNNAALNK